MSSPARLDLNIKLHEPRDVIVIAHRGGVVGEDAHENSRLAIKRAIDRGYDMVEIDIMPTSDNFPVLVHGAWHIVKEGARAPERIATFHDKTLREAKAIRHPLNGETIMTLEEGLDICRGHLGVMLDIKVWDAEREFYERIARAIEEYDFADKTVTISGGAPVVRECLRGKCLFAVEAGPFRKMQRNEIPPDSYGFDIPDILPGEEVRDGVTREGLSENDIALFHERGLAVIVAINDFRYFRYAEGQARHMELAKRDIARFREAGVDGFQIDSIYDRFIFESTPDESRRPRA